MLRFPDTVVKPAWRSFNLFAEKVDEGRGFRHNRIMPRNLPLSLTVFFFSLLSPLYPQAPPHGLRLPEGFEATEFADSSLANDIYCMTLDPKGRVVVSGRGYIRLLVDDNGDGRADRALEFAGAPKDGAMGLFWEGDNLFCMGDGGLRRYRDANGEGRKRPPELIHPFKTGGEHSAHAMRRGPDGWLYVLCGNNTGISRKHATLPTSPIREPIAGCVLRFPPDFKGCEIVADGFRNAYAFDFNSAGDLFTFDSDNERCVSLPWYEPTRCYHVVSGGHYGWQNPQHTQTWRLPPYFLDVVAPVATLGRGSPTASGLLSPHPVSREISRGSVPAATGRSGGFTSLPLERRGSTYAARPEVFPASDGRQWLRTDGGGRASSHRRSVCVDRRARHARSRLSHPLHKRASGVASCAQTAPRQATPQDWIREATEGDLHKRRRALDHIRRDPERFTMEQRKQRDSRQQHPDPIADCVRRRPRCWRPSDKDERNRIDPPKNEPWAEITWGLYRPSLTVVHLLTDKRIAPEVRLDAVRVVQLALGDLMAKKAKGTVWEGYSRRRDDIPVSVEARTALRAAFPSGHADLDRELSRTLAMIEDDDPTLLDRIAARLTADSDPVEDIHYLIVLARLRAPRTAAITKGVASALLALDSKIARRHLNRDTNWPPRIAEMHAELAHKDAALNAALLAHADFGRPDHVLFARCPGFDRRRAAEIILKRSDNDADFPWSAEIITLLGSLPRERIAPVLRRLWGEHGVDDAILTMLARSRARKTATASSADSARLASIRCCVALAPWRNCLRARRSETGIAKSFSPCCSLCGACRMGKRPRRCAIDCWRISRAARGGSRRRFPGGGSGTSKPIRSVPRA